MLASVSLSVCLLVFLFNCLSFCLSVFLFLKKHKKTVICFHRIVIISNKIDCWYTRSVAQFIKWSAVLFSNTIFFLFLANQQSKEGTKSCRIGIFFSVDKTGLQAWMAGPQAWLAGPWPKGQPGRGLNRKYIIWTSYFWLLILSQKLNK